MNSNLESPIYIVGGSKGGVGKSMVATATIDILLELGRRVLLIESDTSNPDVLKAHQDHCETISIDLDKADGWIELVNTCDSNSESTVVINTAARNNAGVRNYGVTLASTLGELRRKLVTLWVINRQRDSLELLKQYTDSIDVGSIHVIRNGYYGPIEKFELYNGSKIKQMIEERGGLSLLFPDLADRVSDDLYSKRLSIAAAIQELPIGNRAELMRWRSEVRRALGLVIT